MWQRWKGSHRGSLFKDCEIGFRCFFAREFFSSCLWLCSGKRLQVFLIRLGDSHNLRTIFKKCPEGIVKMYIAPFSQLMRLNLLISLILIMYDVKRKMLEIIHVKFLIHIIENDNAVDF